MKTPYEIISDLQSLRGGNQPYGVIDPTALAEAFGWARDTVRERTVTVDSASLTLGRAFLGVQPGALFASVSSRRQIGEVALFGYHAAVRWGITASLEGLTAFNSHWLDRGQWYTLPTIPWEQLESQSELISCFVPESIADGAADRLALERYSNPELLQPVDDELVSRLDAWREQALKSSRSQNGVDEQLQSLFARLFVLRTIEDRNLAPSVRPLSESLKSNGELNLANLTETFETARTFIGSDLFHSVSMDLIPTFVITGIIRDLYWPRRLPERHKYNFSWIDTDVLGLAYEKYLSTILHALPPQAQMELFNNPNRGVERISVRRANGVYYTPQYLTKYLAKKTIDSFYEDRAASSIPRVIDFACGSGSFLVAAIDVLLERLKSIDPLHNWSKLLIEQGYISGIDADEKAVTVARLNLWNRLAEEPDPLPLPNLSNVVVQGDGLNTSTWAHIGVSHDIVMGNPPFLATSRVINRNQLEHDFKSAQGRFDYSYLFVEQAIKITEPHGRIGMVVPNRLFRNQNAALIRNMLTEAMDVQVVVDFGANEVFEGTSAYVGCLVAAHRKQDLPPAETTKVIDVRVLPQRFVAAFLLNAEVRGEPNPNIRIYEAQHPRGTGPWILLSRAEKMNQIKISDASSPLASIAGIFQGIRTGANDIFIVQINSDDEQYGIQGTNGLGDNAILERSLLKPVVYGSEVKKNEVVEFDKYLIYPYLNGEVITEAELSKRYPQIHKYLSRYKDILSARSSIEASGLRWYELVRRRDEDWLKRPKLLIRDLAPETSFAIDLHGNIFMVGGSAVVPEREDLLLPLAMYLNSEAVNRIVRRTTPQFRGSFQKFEPQHLQRIPVLNRLLQDDFFSEQLTILANSIISASGSERSTLMTQVNLLIESAMREVE